jgi:hypothetical protein
VVENGGKHKKIILHDISGRLNWPINVSRICFMAGDGPLPTRQVAMTMAQQSISKTDPLPKLCGCSGGLGSQQGHCIFCSRDFNGFM